MSKVTLSNVADYLRQSLNVLDQYVDADEARTRDQLMPIMGDMPTDDFNSLVAFLVQQKFETCLSGLQYQGYSLISPMINSVAMVKSILQLNSMVDRGRHHYLVEYLRLLSSISIDPRVYTSSLKRFHTSQSLDQIRVYDFGGAEITLNELYYWTGASDKAIDIIYNSPELMLALLQLTPKGFVTRATVDIFTALVLRMKRLSNHTSSNQEV